MTPMFGHGRLRLYLLKLLDESPRHGYEIIRLLQDRFLGLYAPSAGTVYPRLAKLEQEGLVTHAVEGGRKVYRITEAGREELGRRHGDLDELEAEIRESVYERAQEIRDEVRTSARNLRDELRQAARGVREQRRPGKTTGKQDDASPRRERPTGKDRDGRRAEGRRSPAEQFADTVRESLRDVPWDNTLKDALRDTVRDEFTAAWARNWGPSLSRKVVDLAEGLANGLSGMGDAAGGPYKDTGDTGSTGTAEDGTDKAAGRTERPHPRPRPHTARRRELERLLDRFRDEVKPLARQAGLRAEQIDDAHEVIVWALHELRDILTSDRGRPE